MDDHPLGQHHSYYRKITRIDSNEICLDADMIRLLIAIDETRQIEEIAVEVGMDDFTVQTTLGKLLELKLIEPVKKAGSYLGDDFVQSLTNHLAHAVGPMAEILIDDVAAEMGMPVAELSRSQAAELVSTLAVEIPEEENRIQFTKAMLELIKSQ